ncbi:NADH-quinone oxidoreductase subunit H [Dehalobacter sp. DCM]|uniref:respiratory chain complex I subunit 1 family protein n=1 Tax=Dehalobacter sp. DCM TaxID=2907827 RepID=UPI0030820260|nr:NADH-quinone oxidoreductase subunit H [Dehalobacter sp. DCM]
MLKVIVLGFVHIFIILLLSPLYEGVMRKVRAVVHSRQGPPLLQPYYDLAKLMIKDDQQVSGDFIFKSAPVLCLGSVILVALFTPMGTDAPLSFTGDALVLVYLLTMSAVFIILGGMASRNPYAFLGANREMMLLLVVEPVLAISLMTGAIKAHSLMLTDISGFMAATPTLSLGVAGLAFFLVIQPEMAKIPFDLAEAETEIMEGPFIEYSGRRLALFKWAFFAKQVIFVSLFAQICLPWLQTGNAFLDIVLNLLKVLVLVVVVELIAALNPRLKIEQAIKYFAWVIVFALAGMGLALLGL